MSFRNYLAKREASDTPAGNFIADARADRVLPDAASWQELKAHLRQRGACMEAMATARVVWNGYDAARRRDDRSDAKRS